MIHHTYPVYAFQLGIYIADPGRVYEPNFQPDHIRQFHPWAFPQPLKCTKNECPHF